MLESKIYNEDKPCEHSSAGASQIPTGTANDKTAAAVLVSITDDKANTITNCGVKGTLDGAAITLSSNMITTDGGATVTGTYLLD